MRQRLICSTTKVVLGARREDRLKALTEEIRAAGGEAVFQVLDVTKQTDNDAIVKLAKDSFGQVDVIFLNAGMHALYETHGIAPERIASVVAFAIGQPEDTNVTEFTVGPTTQPW